MKRRRRPRDGEYRPLTHVRELCRLMWPYDLWTWSGVGILGSYANPQLRGIQGRVDLRGAVLSSRGIALAVGAGSIVDI